MGLKGTSRSPSNKPTYYYYHAQCSVLTPPRTWNFCYEIPSPFSQHAHHTFQSQVLLLSPRALSNSFLNHLLSFEVSVGEGKNCDFIHFYWGLWLNFTCLYTWILWIERCYLWFVTNLCLFGRIQHHVLICLQTLVVDTLCMALGAHINKLTLEHQWSPPYGPWAKTFF